MTTKEHRLIDLLFIGIGCFGFIVVILVFFAEKFHIDPNPGMGPARYMSIVIGVAFIVISVFFLLISHSQSRRIWTAIKKNILEGTFSLPNQWPTYTEILCVAVFALIIVAIDLFLSNRLGLLSHPPFYDGAAYLFISKSQFYRLHHLSIENLLPLLRDLGNNQAPLWNGLMVIHYFLLGEGEWQAYTVRFWPTLLLMLAVYWVVRKKTSKSTGFIALAVTGFLPTVSVGLRSINLEFFTQRMNFANEWYFADLRPDLMMASLMVWMIVPLFENIRNLDKRTLMTSGAFAGLALLCKPSAFCVLGMTWAVALLFSLIWNRKEVSRTLIIFLWGLPLFVLFALPWISSGGLQWAIDYLVFGLTKSKILYSNPNATLGSEALYYWLFYPLHMGYFEGWSILVIGSLTFVLPSFSTRTRDNSLWGYILIALFSYMAASATANKNFFLGLFFYLPLWIFSWGAIAPFLDWVKSKYSIFYKLIFLSALIYAGGVLIYAIVALIHFPEIEFKGGPENRKITKDIALDLQNILGSNDVFTPIAAFGYPNTLSYYMIREDGTFPACWMPNDPTLSLEAQIEQASKSKVIMIYADDIEEVSKYVPIFQAWKPYWKELSRWLESTESTYLKFKEYQFSPASRPLGTYPLGQGSRKGILVRMYVKNSG